MGALSNLPFKMKTNIILLVYVLLLSSNVSHGANIPDFKEVYQDLTESIDKIIHHGDSSFTQVLEKALNRSTLVYYSSDISMNNIMDMMPIINLLNNTKPENSEISIMLSLRYTFQNRFSRQDYNDVFYDLALNITADSWKRLKRYVSHIVLDWNADSCSADYFFSKPGNNIRIPQVSRSFPKYIKNFINFYCGDSPECNVPIGLAFNQIGYCHYLLAQIEHADFYVLTIHFPSYNGFPLTPSLYSEYFQKVKKKLTTLFSQINANNNTNKFLYFKVDLQQKTTAAQVESSWMSARKMFERYHSRGITMLPDWHRILSSSPNFSEVIETRIDKTYWMTFALLCRNTYALVHSKSLPYSVKDGIILGNSVISVLSNYTTREEPDLDVGGVMVPSFYAEEDSASVCDLAKPISVSGTLLIDQYTWRAMQRFEKGITGMPNCQYRGDEKKSMMVADVKVMLAFANGIKLTWPAVEKHMNRLVNEFRNIGNASLATLLFYDTDILADSTGWNRNNSQMIVNFLRKWNNEFSTGCVVDFTGARINRIANDNRGRAGFPEIVVKFCKPIFDITDVMIWKVSKDPYLDFPAGYSGEYDPVIVARDIFLREFPQKQVILMLNPTESEKSKAVANFYGISSVVPSSDDIY